MGLSPRLLLDPARTRSSSVTSNSHSFPSRPTTPHGRPLTPTASAANMPTPPQGVIESICTLLIYTQVYCSLVVKLSTDVFKAFLKDLHQQIAKYAWCFSYVCMYVCACVCVLVCVYLCVGTIVCVYLCVGTIVCMLVCACVCVLVCWYYCVCACVCVLVCWYYCVYACVCLCVCVLVHALCPHARVDLKKIQLNHFLFSGGTQKVYFQSQ